MSSVWLVSFVILNIKQVTDHPVQGVWFIQVQDMPLVRFPCLKVWGVSDSVCVCLTPVTVWKEKQQVYLWSVSRLDYYGSLTYSFVLCSFFCLQVQSTKRADPNELKLIFQKVRLHVSAQCWFGSCSMKHSTVTNQASVNSHAQAPHFPLLAMKTNQSMQNNWGVSKCRYTLVSQYYVL